MIILLMADQEHWENPSCQHLHQGPCPGSTSSDALLAAVLPLRPADKRKASTRGVKI